jgi:branched-chain amino acid transport system substrate-binding protein
MARSRWAFAAAGSVLMCALLLAACGNAKNGASGGTGAPGVTSTAIDVGSIANITGPLSADFAPVVNGVEAYFSMINAQGGVNGRKLYLKYQTDDQGGGSTDLEAAQTLVEKDKVFAIVGVGTPFFSGAAYLASNNIPVFGYSVSTDWENRPTMFADFGSELCFPCGGPGDSYTAEQLGAKSIAVIAYSVPQSKAACQAAVNALNEFGLPLTFSDLNFQFGGDPTADVLQMKAHNVDLLFTCLDVTGNINFARAIQQNGISMNQVWFNGYDRGTLQQYSSLMQGVYFGVQHVPFEAAAAFPGVYPALQTYIKEMKKYQPSFTYNETAMDGWIAADQFVTGLKAVKGNLTQAALVKAVNSETAFTAGGLAPPVNWKTGHSSAPPPYCQAAVKVEGNKFVPAMITGTHSVFTCFKIGSTTPIPGLPGTPGA